MRKLVHALLITLGCFSAAAVYANDETPKEPEVVTTTETSSEEKAAQFRLFQQGEETAEGGETVENEEPKA